MGRAHGPMGRADGQGRWADGQLYRNQALLEMCECMIFVQLLQFHFSSIQFLQIYANGMFELATNAVSCQ